MQKLNLFIRRNYAAAFLVAGLAGTTACAQTPPPASGSAAPASPPASAGQNASQPSVDAVLDQLDERGQSLSGFTADVRLTEDDASTGLLVTRVGKVWFQKMPDDTARMRVSFKERITDVAKKVDEVDYVLEKGWLEERQHARKLAIRRQILRTGEKANLLKLGEGPFPLPIGQKKEEVKRQFDVSLVKASKEDPANSTHVLLRPKAGTALANKFSTIDVWMDNQTHMPVKVETLDPKQTIKTTTLDKVQINPGLKDEDFALPKVNPAEWAITEEPFRE